MPMKENTNQNAFHVANEPGSFHLIDLFPAPLDAMKCFTNKNSLYKTAVGVNVIVWPLVTESRLKDALDRRQC